MRGREPSRRSIRTTPLFASTMRAVLVMVTVLLGVAGLVVALPASAHAQLHGIGFGKGCTAVTVVGTPLVCQYAVSNTRGTDTAGDTLTFTSIVDTVNTLPPTSSSNILPSLPVQILGGGATCNVSGSSTGPGATGNTLCTVPSNGFIVFGPFSFYTPVAGDLDPLTDTAALTWQDLCTSGAGNCPIGNLTASTGSQTRLTCPACTAPNECTNAVCDEVNNVCVISPKQASTPCGDTDGNLCTTAGCEVDPTNAARGICNQTHVVASCPSDQCNTGCNPATGLCAPAAPSTPCGDTDGNACTIAGCELASPVLGFCNQSHSSAPVSTPCGDTDGNLCTTAGCEAGGICNQAHVVTSCPMDQCNTGCSPATGLCVPVAASTPCGDTDGNACTIAGCELASPVLGFCNQSHSFAPPSTPCADVDGSLCTTAGCEAGGVCNQNHVVKQCPTDECNAGCNPTTGQCTPKAPSTPCGDTDGNLCTTPGCELSSAVLGFCNQAHVVKQCPTDECNNGCNPTTGQCTPKAASTPCGDSDGNVCTIAGCELVSAVLGQCIQTHLLAPVSTPCGDTDGNACTAAGCEAGGICNQRHVDLCPCDLLVEKRCAITPPRTAFVCDQAKPIDSLSLRWAGTQAIHVLAWKGAVGSTLLADIDNIVPDQVVTVTGYAGSPNNVIWQLFRAGTVTPLGVGNSLSSFDLSCSDANMNGPEDCGKREGDGRALSGGYVNNWILEGMAGNGQALVCNPTPPPATVSCEVEMSPPDCDSQGKPTSLTFRYTGGGCAAGNNPQNGKFVCTGGVNPGQPITVSSSASGYVIAPTTIAPGGLFTVTASSFSTQSLFRLTNAGGTETDSINTSCSQDLAVGNVFGSLTLVAFNGLSGGVEVTYEYKVTNQSTPLTNVVVTDRVGSTTVAQFGPFNLGTGATQTFTSVADIDATTTNVVTVAGATGTGAQCTATDSLTVSVIPTCVLGYPFTSSNPRTSVVFNESEVLRALTPAVARPGGTISVFYNDEHALTLGVRRVVVRTAAGTTRTDYPLSPLPSSPANVLDPQVGTTALTGDQAGTDLAGRPMYPALFITDITSDPSSKAGDWQFGGTAIPPHAVFGTWKGAVRTVDKTTTPATVTITPDADPVKNDWNLGPDSDVPPGGFASLVNQGFGAEVRWNVDDLVLQAGHVYRIQVMVHDGDQNKVGGDVGQACLTVVIPPE